MRKGEKKLIEKYRKIEEKPQNFKKFKEFLISFLERRMDDYVIDASQKIIRLHPSLFQEILKPLCIYVIEFSYAGDYRRSTDILKKWKNLKVKKQSDRSLLALSCSISKKLVTVCRYQNEGLSYLKERQYNEAIKILQRAVKIEKCLRSKYKRILATFFVTAFFTHSRLAFAYRRIQKYEEAINEYFMCLKLIPWATMPYYHMGDIFMERNEYETAIELFEKARQLFVRGKEMIKSKDELFILSQEARIGFEEEEKITETRYHHAKGMLNLSKGNLKESRESFLQANRLIEENNFSNLYPFLVLPQLVEIDEKIRGLYKVADFNELEFAVKTVIGELTAILENTKKNNNMYIHDFFYTKFVCVFVLLDAINPEFKKTWRETMVKKGVQEEEINKQEKLIFDLEFPMKFFSWTKQVKAEQFVHWLKIFVLEIKQYSGPAKEIPIEKQRALIASLEPFFNGISEHITLREIIEKQNLLLGQYVEFKQGIEDMASKVPEKTVELMKKEEIKEAKLKGKIKERMEPSAKQELLEKQYLVTYHNKKGEEKKLPMTRQEIEQFKKKYFHIYYNVAENQLFEKRQGMNNNISSKLSKTTSSLLIHFLENPGMRYSPGYLGKYDKWKDITGRAREDGVTPDNVTKHIRSLMTVLQRDGKERYVKTEKNLPIYDKEQDTGYAFYFDSRVYYCLIEPNTRLLTT